ncbi:substrate-binding periplasmic protein [Balneatrix alpica]|uniref:substrate-binding periplasmic protein n=1 Tax=Balneatrix alpica TaxID=75684 RepID=UPI00273A0B40|nr:transporter substrate-binding domain-containing protein [Balneatrix alpica]
MKTKAAYLLRSLGWGWLSLLLSGLSPGLMAREYDHVIASGHIYIGLYRDFPPYSFVDEQGQPRGVDVEIGQRIAAGLGVEFRPHWITPDENLEDDLRNHVWKGHYLDKDEDNPLAAKHLADVMLRVPYDREFSYMRDSTGELINEQVVMFAPYQRERWQLAYDRRQLSEVSTLALFQYHPIGVEIDSLPAFYLTSALQGRLRDQARHYPNVGQAFQAMQAQQVAAVMGMGAEIDWQLRQANNPDFAAGSNAFPLIGKQKWDIGMAVKHTYRQLGYAVEAIVEQMILSGEMAALFQRYGLHYELPPMYSN